jgi:parallel beta-helix repeat protein
MTLRDGDSLNVTGNSVTNSQGSAGIQIFNVDNSFIEGNTVQGNVGNGILVQTGSSNNTIRADIDPVSGLPRPNDISGNGAAGVFIEGASSDGNTISQNSITNNVGLGIDLDGAGSNNDMPAPVIASAAIVGPNIEVTGSATPGATVEVFVVGTDDGAGEGETYIGSDTANGAGIFLVSEPNPGLVSTDQVTTTATDATDGTSEFSANEAIP